MTSLRFTESLILRFLIVFKITKKLICMRVPVFSLDFLICVSSPHMLHALFPHVGPMCKCARYLFLIMLLDVQNTDSKVEQVRQ